MQSIAGPVHVSSIAGPVHVSAVWTDKKQNKKNTELFL